MFLSILFRIRDFDILYMCQRSFGAFNHLHQEQRQSNDTSQPPGGGKREHLAKAQGTSSRLEVLLYIAINRSDLINSDK